MPETLAVAAPTSLSLATLPALLQPLAGGTYCGVITHDGVPCAVVLLSERPTQRLTWKKAMDWAASVESQLPTRPVAALLYATARTLFKPDWYWTNEPDGESCAWNCDFSDGFQTCYYRSSEGCAVAVRLIPLVS